MFLFYLVFSLFSFSPSLPAQEEVEIVLEAETILEEIEIEEMEEETSIEPIFNFNEEKTEEYTLYYYNEDLDNYRGLKVIAQIGYRIPNHSPIEAGYEISIIFTGNENSTDILESLGNQATIQVYSPLTGLLRFRLILNKEMESLDIIEDILYDEEEDITEEEITNISYKVIYRVKEANYLFFNRLLNELKGDRDAMLLLYNQDSKENVRVNLGLSLPSLIEFSQSIKKLR